MKDILIISDFCGPLDGTFNSRFLYLADMLVDKGFSVEIITSDFHHGSKSYFSREIEKHNFTITMLHEGSYKKNISIKRFWAHYIWGLNVKKYLNKRVKPDVIYCAVPTLNASFVAGKYCEKNNVRFVIDIQDLWPEAFKMVFNIPIISNVIFSPFNYLANNIYKCADSICAVSDTYCLRALKVNRKCNTFKSVFLGTELDTFDNYSKKPLNIEKNKNEIWIVYCGTLGASYNLTIVFDALKLIQNSPSNNTIKFIILGDGERKNEFESYAKDNKIDCVFTGRLPYDDMCAWLSLCDIAVNPITHNASQSIINKHGDYASAGLPVINTQENKEYRQLIENYKMGFNCSNNDIKEFADKLLLLLNNDLLRNEMKKNARRCAEEKFDRKYTYNALIDSIVKH